MNTITFEELEVAKAKVEEEAKPLKAWFEEQKKEFDRKCDAIEKPFLDLLEGYLTQCLVDKNGVAVKAGDSIEKDGIRYHVHTAGLQFVFGFMFDNPKVICKKVGASAKARDKYISPSELKEYERVVQ